MQKKIIDNERRIKMLSIKRDPITVYQCTYCGKTESRTKFQGRPMPGYCPRRACMKDGKPYPHRWVISKKF